MGGTQGRLSATAAPAPGRLRATFTLGARPMPGDPTGSVGEQAGYGAPQMRV